MYHEFYRLDTDPFRLTPDPAFCFRHERYARALAYMQYALRQGEGFIMVTGLPGTGKTTLIEQFHSEFDGVRTLIARLTSTQLQADELLRLICLSLGVSIEARDKADILHGLREFCVRQANKGKRILLLIDEAQDLPMQALEELRLLGNLQLNARPLLQIFLVGQEQLLDVMRLPAMRPLFQRLVAACHLEPLSVDETRAYIQHRLNRAGWNGDPTIDERSYRMIHRFSAGFPRQINKVCSRLLLYGSTERKHALDCFDCLKVLRHLLEELPGSGSESSFEACVDVLNESWGAAASGEPVDAQVEVLLSPAGQEGPPSAGSRTAPQAEPEPARVEPDGQHAAALQAQDGVGQQAPTVPATGQPDLDHRYAALEKAQLASGQQGGAPAPLTAGPDPRGNSRSAGADGYPLARSASRSDTEAPPFVPVNVTHSPAQQRRWPSTARPRLRPNPVAHRAGAPLGLLAVLLAGLLLLAGEEDSGGTGDLAGATDEADLPGSMLVVAQPEPESGLELADSSTIPEAGNAGDSVPGAELASLQEQPEPASSGASGATVPVVESLPPRGESLANAALSGDEFSWRDPDQQQAVLPVSSADRPVEPPLPPEQAAADAVESEHGPAQSRDAGPAVPAASDSAATATQALSAVPVESQDGAAEAQQLSGPGTLANVGVLEVMSSPESQGGEQHAPAQDLAEPEAARLSAEQQRIDQLMARAERALRANRLTVPQRDNAYRYYREVLEIAPQYHGARAGMQRIAQRYVSLVESALAADQIAKAQKYVARGLMVSPGHRELVTLGQHVTARESWLEAQLTRDAEVQPPPAEEQPPAQRFLDKLKTFFSNPVPPDMP